MLDFQVIGAVLNSIGLGSQNASNVVGGVQPNMQVEFYLFILHFTVGWDCLIDLISKSCVTLRNSLLSALLIEHVAFVSGLCASYLIKLVVVSCAVQHSSSGSARAGNRRNTK